MVAEAWLSSQIFSFSTLYAWPNLSLSLSIVLFLPVSLLKIQRYISPSLNPFFGFYVFVFKLLVGFNCKCGTDDGPYLCRMYFLFSPSLSLNRSFFSLILYPCIASLFFGIAGLCRVFQAIWFFLFLFCGKTINRCFKKSSQNLTLPKYLNKNQSNQIS